MWLRRLLLAAFGVLVAIAGTELWLRHSMALFFGPAADYRDLCALDEHGWPQPVPGTALTHTIGGVTVTAHLNELGLRGDPVPPPAPGQHRVLVIGDSIPFGVGVEDDQTFTARLQPLLADALHEPVVARSAGAPGFSPIDAAHTLEDVRDAFAPDLVVCCVFLGNDFEDNYVTKTVVDGYQLTGPLAAAAQQSLRMRLALRFRVCWLVEDFIRTRLPSLTFKIPPPPTDQARDFPPAPKSDRGLFVDAKTETPAIGHILDRMEQALETVRKAAAGTPVLVVLLPDDARASKKAWLDYVAKCQLDPDQLEMGAGQRRIEQRCQKLGLPCFDVTPAFLAADHPERLFLHHDFHYSPAGHELVAHALAGELTTALQR